MFPGVRTGGAGPLKSGHLAWVVPAGLHQHASPAPACPPTDVLPFPCVGVARQELTGLLPPMSRGSDSAASTLFELKVGSSRPSLGASP